MNKLLTHTDLVRMVQRWIQISNLYHHVKHRHLGPDDWLPHCACGNCVARVNREAYIWRRVANDR